jgi:predicted metal-binding membrane protein
VTLLALSAAAWLATLAQSRSMSSMGDGLGAFLVTWALMMTAMMLPSILPVARAYLRALRARTTGAERLARTVGWHPATCWSGRPSASSGTPRGAASARSLTPPRTRLRRSRRRP